ncbi:ssDNA-binding protein [Limosilactobacillus fermentum]|uniref:ssDNA-binding protein n=1 Tax=Limosilactobacillus fermentum TaxID=1613 RepID=UPI003BA8BD77
MTNINFNGTKVVTGLNTRLSYVHLLEPAAPLGGGKEKYSASVIIPKSDTKTIEQIEAAIQNAINSHLEKFGGKMPNMNAIKTPLRDGDTERDDEAYRDSYFLNAKLKEVCLKAFNKIIEPNKAFRAKLQNNIRHAISQLNEEQATKLDRELDRLQILLINQTPYSKDYDKITGEFNKVQQQRDELQLTLDRQNEVVQKNVNLQNFIDTNSKQLNEFDEHLVRQLIKKITIQETYCEVEFQNGDSIKINL